MHVSVLEQIEFDELLSNTELLNQNINELKLLLNLTYQ